VDELWIHRLSIACGPIGRLHPGNGGADRVC